MDNAARLLFSVGFLYWLLQYFSWIYAKTIPKQQNSRETFIVLVNFGNILGVIRSFIESLILYLDYFEYFWFCLVADFWTQNTVKSCLCEQYQYFTQLFMTFTSIVNKVKKRMFIKTLNSFLTNVPILYTLKRPENSWWSYCTSDTPVVAFVLFLFLEEMINSLMLRFSLSLV